MCSWPFTIDLWPYLFVISCASKCLSDARLQDVRQSLHAETLQVTTRTHTQTINTRYWSSSPSSSWSAVHSTHLATSHANRTSWWNAICFFVYLKSPSFIYLYIHMNLVIQPQVPSSCHIKTLLMQCMAGKSIRSRLGCYCIQTNGHFSIFPGRCLRG